VECRAALLAELESRMTAAFHARASERVIAFFVCLLPRARVRRALLFSCSLRVHEDQKPGKLLAEKKLR
jgi:hypothetical protein